MVEQNTQNSFLSSPLNEQNKTKHTLLFGLIVGLLIGALIFFIGHFAGQFGSWLIVAMTHGSRASDEMQELGKQDAKSLALFMDCFSIGISICVIIFSVAAGYTSKLNQPAANNDKGAGDIH